LDGSVDPSLHVGYRKKLYNDLEILAGGRYNIDFVGSVTTGTADTGLADNNHEGHPGWCDGPIPCAGGGNITDYVQTWLDSEPADIILLHIGTNDFEANEAGDVAGTAISPPSLSDSILDNIDTWESNNHPLTVFLAKIIDDTDADLSFTLDVTTFNTGLDGLVAGRAGDRVFMVDQQIGAGLTYVIDNTVPYGDTGDMAGDLHPNPAGYNKMADRWYTDITTAPVGAKFQGLPQCP